MNYNTMEQFIDTLKSHTITQNTDKHKVPPALLITKTIHTTG